MKMLRTANLAEIVSIEDATLDGHGQDYRKLNLAICDVFLCAI